MTSPRVPARDLFEQLSPLLDWRWLAGQAGGDRRVEATSTNARRPSLAGYLNAIYPNKVQILGTEDIA